MLVLKLDILVKMVPGQDVTPEGVSWVFNELGNAVQAVVDGSEMLDSTAIDLSGGIIALVNDEESAEIAKRFVTEEGDLVEPKKGDV